MTADVQRELAEALRNHRDGVTITGDPEQDSRPGAPCMDCGDYPGLRHEGSDCPRAVSRALLPTVQALIADAEKRAAAAALRDAAEDTDGGRRFGRYDTRADIADQLRDRAAALDPSGAAEGAGR